jgi:hypothetical protein
MKKVFAGLAAVGMLLAFAGAAQAAPNPRVFTSVPDQLPPNVSSYGPEAYAFAQLGDAIQLAPGKRVLKNVTVTMSDWACQTGTWTVADSCVTAVDATFPQAITFNIYNLNNNGSVGSLVASKTQTFDIKFRPSSDNVTCDGTAWLASNGNCYHGLAQNITFAFGASNVHLPNTLVYGISFDTTHYGPSPIGESTTCFADTTTGCAYDALNIAAAAGAPKRGMDLNLGGFYIDGTYGGTPADSPCTPGTAATPGTFSLDDGCQYGFNPLVRFLVKK